jgi:hypothetical protein
VNFSGILIPQNLLTGRWKQHIHCRRNQQVRGHQGGGAEALA